VGDPFKKVRPGEALQIPAETFNTFLDAARDFKARQRSIARDDPVRRRACRQDRRYQDLAKEAGGAMRALVGAGAIPSARQASPWHHGLMDQIAWPTCRSPGIVPVSWIVEGGLVYWSTECRACPASRKDCRIRD
jgi:hypothetical protein